jgi:hypothetical protein
MVSFTEYIKNKELNEADETFDDLISKFGTSFKSKDKSKEMASRLLAAASKTPEGKDRLETISAKAKEGSLSASDIKDPTTKNLALAIEVMATGAKDGSEALKTLKTVGIEPEENKTISKSSVIKSLKAVNKPSIKAIKPADTKPAEEPTSDDKPADAPADDETPDKPANDEPADDKTADDKTDDNKTDEKTPEETGKKKTDDEIARSKASREKIMKGEKAPNAKDSSSPAYFAKQASDLKDEKIAELKAKIKDFPEEKHVGMTKVVDKMEQDLNKKIDAINKQQNGYSYKSNFGSRLKATTNSKKLFNEIKATINKADTKHLTKTLDGGLTRLGKSVANSAKGVKRGVKAVADSRAVQITKDKLKSASGKTADAVKKGAKTAAPVIKRATGKVTDKIQTASADSIIKKWLPAEFEKFVNSDDAAEKAGVLEKAKKARDFARTEADKARRIAKAKTKQTAPKTPPPANVMKAKTAAEKAKDKIQTKTA